MEKHLFEGCRILIIPRINLNVTIGYAIIMLIHLKGEKLCLLILTHYLPQKKEKR